MKRNQRRKEVKKAEEPKLRCKVTIVSEEQMWAEKRAKQAKDYANVVSGRIDGMAMGWFSEERMKTVEIPNSPY
ncbi:hypothetical protein ACQ86G_00520 [Roseateles chitinivorans]|uniref:hypothetical protein n=1 Tax=Roseateles chitinivorans TaxID=2917965 RepID=UPI003D66922C